MAPLSSTASITLLNLSKRTYNNCSYYDSSCSNTHRIVILIIIIFVGALVGLIFSLLYARNRKRRTSQDRRARQAREHMNIRKMNDPLSGATYEAPPPYMPRKPESAARLGR